MNQYLATAIKAAQAAAAIHRFYAADPDKQVGTKANYADIVTKVDKLSETRIREVIAAAYPDHAVLGEEQGQRGAGGATHRWIVDPLDGTINYASGFPFYSVSIALEVEGRLEVGVVLDSVSGRLFTAVRGEGAQADGAPLSVSGVQRVASAVLSTGFNADEAGITASLPLFEKALRHARGVRRAGSAALDLCMVACGQADGFWELTLNPWDVAAGVLIVREAGGRVTDERGRDFEIEKPLLVASNGLVHDEMLRVLGFGGG